MAGTKTERQNSSQQGVAGAGIRAADIQLPEHAARNDTARATIELPESAARSPAPLSERYEMREIDLDGGRKLGTGRTH